MSDRLPSLKAVVASGKSGLLWGLLGSYLTREHAGGHSWFAAPGGILIGLLVFHVSHWAYRRSVWLLVPTSIVTMFMAVALFGLCIGVADLMRDIPNRIAWAVVVQSMNACLWGLVFIPLHWSLFLLSFGNHVLLRYLVRTEAAQNGPASGTSPVKNLLVILLFACCLSGCKHKGSKRAVLNIEPAMLASLRAKPVHIEPGSRLESFVGKRVELVGTVSDAGVPQIQGVDLWGLEQFRGKRLHVSGVLQRTVVSSNSGDSGNAQDSGTDGFVAPVYRGTGTFYRL